VSRPDSVRRRLVIAWGNDARGDDALGPLLLDALRTRAADASWAVGVTWRREHQLQVELVEALQACDSVLFIDASHGAAPPFRVTRLTPAAVRTVSTHSLPPSALLRVYLDVYRAAPPPATLLAVRGASFELGAPLTTSARAHLGAALDWAVEWLARSATDATA
jgi:hydrogenase maturation protease